jgi:malate dehydrogenase (oxaloacetate-decarboxylating)
MDVKDQALSLHKKNRGKIELKGKIPVDTREDLSLVYTPGVAHVSRLLATNKELVDEYTFKGNAVAVISDGSAVLGLGNIGPEGAYPVMEGKCLIFKRFANIDAIPILLNTQDPSEIIQTIKHIAPSFGGINLEDIAAPKCFFIESELKKTLSIPVIHDDQWGAAVAVLAGLLNSLKLKNISLQEAKIVVLGAGAAGSATVKLLHNAGARHMIVCDSRGIIFKGRDDDTYKEELAAITNEDDVEGDLTKALMNADVFIGLSKANMLTAEMVQKMGKDPIIFALANPDPEITQEDALKAGAFIYASGRSDFANQINNAIVYPGVFRGALDHKLTNITPTMLIRVATTLAQCVEKPTRDNIVPSIFDTHIVGKIAANIFEK